jgi:fumarate reductase flavoprotein subunit
VKTSIRAGLAGFVLLGVLAACASSDEAAASPMDTSTYHADVIIVGAGGAGMAAAIHAAKAGASVIILEKSSVVGGNTLPAQAGINALVAGDAADINAFIMTQTNDLADPDLVKYMVVNSKLMLEWLKTDIGMVFNTPTGTGRMYQPADGSIFAETVIPKLYADIVSKGVNVLFNMRATTLIKEGGRITGVKATDTKGNELEFKGNAVILATGGFGQDNAWVTRLRPEYKDWITSEIAPATGDGLVMAQAIDAVVVDLDQMQHSTAPLEWTTHAMILGATRNGMNYIIVNNDGKRFISETETIYQQNVIDQPGHFAYFVFDQTGMNIRPLLQTYFDRGIVSKGSSAGELAKNLGIDGDDFELAVTGWNAVCQGNAIDGFERAPTTEQQTQMFNTPPYYAIKFSFGLHYFMGGLKINTDTQVINTSGQVIPGLYAAGEVTGGVHGNRRVDGSALTDTFVFGRQAGIQAAAYALSQGKLAANVPSAGNQGSALKGNFTDGVYTGTGRGRNGDITVQLMVEDKSITKITVLSNVETPSMFMIVENDLIPSIIRTQSVWVDTITGATYSSKGVLDAVADALGISRQ